MSFPFFQVLNYCLIAFALLLFGWYIWDRIANPDYMPEAWKRARKKRELSKILIRVERKYADKVRFFNFWFQVRRLKNEKVPGAFAEVGVYQGQSAKAIHHMDDARKFHLFDTFRGFTAEDLSVEQGEAATYTTNNFADTCTEKVLRNIGGNGNIVLLPGYFPASAVSVMHEKFALVNIDADLYRPTRAGLEFFYPRLSPGGVILIHDYNYKWEGVMKAVDDFGKTIPEAIVHVPDRDGTVMIIRRKF